MTSNITPCMGDRAGWALRDECLNCARRSAPRPQAGGIFIAPPLYFPCQNRIEANVNEYAEPGELQNLTKTADMVNKPPHYTAGKVECIDALEAASEGLTGIEAHCTCNAIKYLWRWKRKGGYEDLKKARWYINRILGEAK